MENKIKKLSEPLDINDLSFRVQSISSKGYITILPYKNSRIDMERLDDAVGPLNWKREHVRDNKNCIVSIWDEDRKHWVSKEDTGTESNTEKEKGLASDSFKRTCVNWGIGRELYSYPRIFLQLYPNEFKVKKAQSGKEIGTPTFDFKLDKWNWDVEIIDGEVKKLIGKDDTGRIRFDSTKDFNGIPKGNQQTNNKQASKPQEKKEEIKKKPKMLDTSFNAAMKSENIKQLEKALTSYDLTTDQLGSLSIRIAELKDKN